ncbi:MULTISPECIES: cytochrome P450 [unclassified Amycolatopsis]|uniref:cytochrome P450 n=1 Tax=unclassified Amycolatopsis TaxID=2618356 RepID=UPI002874E95F|nr:MULTISPECIES: cytochrome P450 [unclassified Amycolatopsis]MDS0135289.1 cytochrome P450 [Amycolatopsis sp. 505]MDS0141020.1 cytochrome P450 [Amycolatopsis sp. CM201R]
MTPSHPESLPRFPFEAATALEPPAEWAEFREKCPVARVALASGDEAALITRYADVKTVLSDPRFTRPTPGDNAARVADTESGGVFNSEMASVLPQHGEDHLTWRRMIGKWFTAKRMNALRPGMAAMAGQLIDEMVAKGAPGDLKAGLAFPLPVWVICDMLGVPDTDRDRFAHWSDVMLSMTRYTQAEFDAAQAEFGRYMGGHLAAKRAEPGDDILSALIADGAGWSDAKLAATGIGLLIAGHETTANMIAKMTAMLLADRSRWEQLLADPSLVRTAVEEALRADANAGVGMQRYLTEDFEVGGTVLPAGTTAMCSMAAANRDESAFENAAELDLTRSPNPHLAFGAGAHACLGQPLARTELQVVLEVLLRKLPNLELAVPADELRRVEGLAVGGLRELPVRW